ncbi:hypothetical protein PFISCL1PPCAC_10349, partial [Pristionchus fissidentatus]
LSSSSVVRSPLQYCGRVVTTDPAMLHLIAMALIIPLLLLGCGKKKDKTRKSSRVDASVAGTPEKAGLPPSSGAPCWETKKPPTTLRASAAATAAAAAASPKAAVSPKPATSPKMIFDNMVVESYTKAGTPRRMIEKEMLEAKRVAERLKKSGKHISLRRNQKTAQSSQNRHQQRETSAKRQSPSMQTAALNKGSKNSKKSRQSKRGARSPSFKETAGGLQAGKPYSMSPHDMKTPVNGSPNVPKGSMQTAVSEYRFPEKKFLVLGHVDQNIVDYDEADLINFNLASCLSV